MDKIRVKAQIIEDAFLHYDSLCQGECPVIGSSYDLDIDNDIASLYWTGYWSEDDLFKQDFCFWKEVRLYKSKIISKNDIDSIILEYIHHDFLKHPDNDTGFLIYNEYMSKDKLDIIEEFIEYNFFNFENYSDEDLKILKKEFNKLKIVDENVKNIFLKILDSK